MTNLTVLEVGKKKVVSCTVEKLRELLARAEAGEICGFTGIIEFPDETYQAVGSTTMSRLQTSGALLDAAIQRLQDG